MPVSFIDYKDKKILYVDHRNLSGGEMLQNMKNAVDKVMSKREGNVSMLADFRESNFSNEIVDYLKTDEVKEFSKFIKKQAIIGIKGIKKLVFKVYNKVTGSGAKIFDDETSAKDFLIS